MKTRIVRRRKTASSSSPSERRAAGSKPGGYDQKKEYGEADEIGFVASQAAGRDKRPPVEIHSAFAGNHRRRRR
jgi:hypothetical protein